MSKKSSVKAVSFVAKLGTGKTTLLVREIRELSSCGYRVGNYKASHHFDIDLPGRDSYRIAAAVLTMIKSAEKLALVQYEPTELDIETLLLHRG